jgi:predicted lipoprotein with Yx(FWY)xxD motif
MGSLRGPSLSRRRAFSVAAGAAVAGGALLIASAAIHLDLYLTGYRTIPTIGWMFLLQVIAAFGLGALMIVAIPSRYGLPLAAMAGALFALSTLGGYLLSLRFGLFGFREVQTTAGLVAGIVEVAAFVALVVVVMQTTALGRAAMGGGGAVAVIAAALLAAGFATAPGGGSAGPAGGQVTSANGQVLRIGKVGSVPVLTNDSGKTLYWFAPDTATASKCYGDCAVYWPPVYGKPVAGPGVDGKLGTITRTGGKLQATYDGRPLYLYIGDSGPGVANGNDIDLNGGYWYEVKP